MDGQMSIINMFPILQEVEKDISKEAKKQVMIENAINIRLLCDYVVSCSYEDIILITQTSHLNKCLCTLKIQ